MKDSLRSGHLACRHLVSLRKFLAPALLALAVSISGVVPNVALAEKIPSELEGIGIEEHLGQPIDLNLTFQDETGRPVALKNYFGGKKPVMLFLVYYGCPNLCTFVLNASVDSIKPLDFSAGDKFEMVAVSIDPSETPALASEKKQAYLKLYGRPETAAGWHFLVGKQPEITKLAQQVGFKYRYDEEQKQYAHTSAFFVLTPDGKISRYFYGIQYPTNDVKVALLEASHGRMGTVLDKILLFCYHYDASTKKYVLMANRIMSAGGAVTVLVLGAFLGLAWRRERAQSKA